jgi:DnaJ domain
MNYYDILEVSSKASPAVIKAAYKSLMQRYHPDKNNNDSDSAQRTANLVQAYEVLSDDARRAGYDQQMQSQSVLQPPPSLQAASMPKRTVAYPLAKPEHDAKGYWVVWLLIITTICLAMWFLLRPPKPTSSELSPALPVNTNGLRADPLAKEVQTNTAFANNRLVMLEIAVSLTDIDKLPAGSVKILKVPMLRLGIAHPDAKKLLWYLDDRKEQLRQSIETKLAFAEPAKLLQATGTKYVQELVWQTISDLATAQSPDLASQAYNIEIDLPKAFTLGLYEKNQLQAVPIK